MRPRRLGAAGRRIDRKSPGLSSGRLVALAAFGSCALGLLPAAAWASGSSEPHATSSASSSAASSGVLSTSNLGYTPLSSPMRIADTRTGATDPSTYAGMTLSEGSSLTVDIPASAGVPASAGAVVVNVTAVVPTAAGFLAVYPGGTSNPGTANVTFTAGQTVGNTVTVGLGPDSATSATQSFTVYDGPSSNGGNVDFTADLEGYYAQQTSTSGAAYEGLTPARVYDSRGGSGEPGAGTTLIAGSSDTVTVAGVGGVPATASAVVLNVALTNATTGTSAAPNFIYAYPAGSAPTTPVANQDYVAGETLSSQVVVGVGTGGAVSIVNHAGSVDVVVDVDGYFTQPGGMGSLFNPLDTPMRLLDTRPGNLAGGASTSVAVQGTGATAGVLNITDVYEETSGGNFLTDYPTGATEPTAANVNYTTGDTYAIVPNASYATVGTSASVTIANGPASAGAAAVVVDEFGYFAPSTAGSFAVTPSTPQTPSVSNSLDATAGNINYTVSGVPSGTTVSLALFPATGADAPTLSDGTLTFAPTTANTASAAAGQGTTDNGAGGSGAFVDTINGTTFGSNLPGNSHTGAPGVNGRMTNVAPSSGGQVTFTVNSFVADGTIPVVWSEPSGATADTLMVNADGTPQSGYSVAAGGSSTWSATSGTYGVTPSIAETPSTSTSSSPTAGNVTYTVNGIASGSTIDIALFPSTGTDAPTVTNGRPVFAPSTAGTASAAAGQGTTNKGAAGTGSFVESVNGASTGNNATGNVATGAPQADAALISVSPPSGDQVSFTVNSFVADGTIPVVWSQPTGATSDTLLVNADGTPQTGYTVGVGGPVTWGSAAGPLSISPSTAQSESPSSGTTSPSDTSGNVNYTVTGVPTGSTVNIALFPSLGVDAPSLSTGVPTFTPLTAGVAGQVAGQGVTNVGPAGKGAFVETVNGAGTGGNAAGNTDTGAPNANAALIRVAASGGQVTFTVNSFVADGTIPVVWSQPSGAASDTLMVNANGTVQTGYSVAVGGAATWGSAGTADYENLQVLSVNTSSDTFQACTTLPSTGCQTFTYGVSGDIYTYPSPSGGGSPLDLTASQFAADLSGPLNGDSVPSLLNAYPTAGTTTLVAATGNTGEDVIDVLYNPSGVSSFSFANADNGKDVDVPAAPTGVTATAGSSGVTVSWVAVPNQNVSDDTEASTVTALRASYGIYRATVTSGVPGTFTNIGSTTITANDAPPTSFVDTTALAAGTYDYEVIALSNDTNGNALQASGPASAPASVSMSAAAPLSVSTSVVPSTATTLASGDALVVNFNEPVSVSGTFSLNLRDGTDAGSINQTDSTAALSNGNETVTYTLTGAPALTSGTSLNLTNLEVFSQSGVSSSAGAWNLAASATGTNNPASTATSGLSRVFGGANSAIGTGPTVSFDATNDKISVTCTSGAAVNVYNPTTGASLGTATCTGSAQDVTTSTTPSAGQTVLATQVPAAAGGRESLSTSFVVPPFISSGSTVNASNSIVLIYTQPVSCIGTGTNSDWTGTALGGSTVTACLDSGATTLTLDLSGSTSTIGGMLTYTEPTPSTSNAVFGGTSAAPVFTPTQSVTVG